MLSPDAGTADDADLAAADTTTTTVSSGLSGDTPPTTTSIPTTTLPPRLGDRVPDGPDEIRVTFVDDTTNGLWATTWHRATAQPATPRLVGTDVVWADYDASGWALAVLRGWANQSLEIGDSDLMSPVFAGVTSMAWHSDQPGRIAWTGRPPGEAGTALYQVSIADRQNGVGSVPPVDALSIVRITDLPHEARLAAWGDWGYAVQVPALDAYAYGNIPDPDNPDGPTIPSELWGLWILDPETGEPRGSLPGLFESAAPDGTMIVRSRRAAYDYWTGTGVPPTDLGLVEPVVTRPLRNGAEAVIGPNLRRRSVVLPPGEDATRMFSPDGETVAAVRWTEGRLDVTSQLRDGTRRRLTQIVGADTLLGFTSDGRFLMAADAEANRLYFHDWSAGTTFDIAFDPGEVNPSWIVAAGG